MNAGTPMPTNPISLKMAAENMTNAIMQEIKTAAAEILKCGVVSILSKPLLSNNGSRSRSCASKSAKSITSSSDGGDPDPEPTHRKAVPFSKTTLVIPSFFLFLSSMILSAHLYCEVAK